MKKYSDCYLYQKYPLYTKRLTDAILKDPIIDKSTDSFKDIIYEVKRARISESLIKVLNSTNTILLDCDNPLPRSFKVFYAKDIKSKNPNDAKIFIDTTGVITKRADGSGYNVDEIKLISYLINGAICMIYNKNETILTRNQGILLDATACFAKSLTFIIDYLVKVSIQESNKIRVLYLTSMYFLEGILKLNNPNSSKNIAMKVAGISDREATMVDIMMDKVATDNNKLKSKDFDPYESIKTFISCLRDCMHFNDRTVTTDIVVERWMAQFGPGTVFAIEYFPALSAMMTDAYTGGYLNQQKTIEKVCGQDMISYSKGILRLIDNAI